MARVAGREASGTLEIVDVLEHTPVAGEPARALGALADSLRDCTKCGLCGSRTQVVFGVGDPAAALMFVGEGPGFHEDRQGEPFVGQAGKLLNELLGGIGRTRGDVYIANVVKCRPPENRDPAPDEIAACSPHLMQQIGIIRPKVVCTLGRFATKLLADTDLSMTAIHGKAKAITLTCVDTVVFPVFHPAAALYTPANRQVLAEDFAKLRILLERGLEPANAVRSQAQREEHLAQAGRFVLKAQEAGLREPRLEGPEAPGPVERPRSRDEERAAPEAGNDLRRPRQRSLAEHDRGKARDLERSAHSAGPSGAISRYGFPSRGEAIHPSTAPRQAR